MKAKNLLKKAFLLLALMGGATSAWGDVTWPDANFLLLDGNDKNQISNGNSVSYTNQVGGTGATWSCNTSKYSYGNTSCTFYGNDFTKGLKHEGSTYTQVVTTATATLTIVQSLATNPTGSFDIETVGSDPSDRADINSFNPDKLLVSTYSGTQTVGGKTYKDVKVFKLHNLPAGTYKIYRGTSPTAQTYAVYMGVTYETTPTYAISSAMSNEGTGCSVSGAGTFLSGKTVTLTATAGAGKSFDHWELGGSNVSTDNPYSFTASATATYTAVFADATTYNITASVATGQELYGSVSPNGVTAVSEGDNHTITATPTEGYYFVDWTVDGVANASTNNPYTFSSVNAAHTIVANFEKKPVISFAAGEGTGTVPASVALSSKGSAYTVPAAYFLYKEGATLTGWRVDETTYAIGDVIASVTEDITLTAQYTTNTVALGDAAATVNWTFARNSGAPTLSYEGTQGVYVQHTTISDTRFDAVMQIDTRQDEGIIGSKGKLNNTTDATKAQVNKGTKFTIPASRGMVITVTATSTGSASVSSMKFDGNNADSYADGTLTYTYNGAATTIDIIDQGDNLYPSGISVSYPIRPTKWSTPTIAVGDFYFENKGYKVTITGEETLKVSTDGENYTTETSPYVTYATATTHYYAKSTGDGLSDSDVADKNVTNTFDGGKSYVAWIYESNYKNTPNNYDIATDALHTALKAMYNVVDVDIKNYKSSISDEQKTALNGNLDGADLVVISEATSGSSKGLLALKDIVGTVPMLNMKFYAYSADRWAWGTPKNVGTATADVKITPTLKNYKVLYGVTFDGDDVALFDYPNEQNHIQYVDSWTAEPSGDVVLANVNVSSNDKPVMHASTTQKYFALGISCDDFTKYNANAIAIVKNAAAMLIAGENLDAVQTSTTITPAYEKSTYVTTKILDFSNVEGGLKAYVATNAAAGVVTLDEVGVVPAGTPLMLVGTAGTEYTVPVAVSASAPETNMFRAGDGTTVFNGTTFDYILFTDGLFYKIGSGTVATNKAYLHCTSDPTAGGARELRISFGDDITGIEQIDNGQLTIDNSQDGKFIENGKLVIVKNGVKYNAAGAKLY